MSLRWIGTQKIRVHILSGGGKGLGQFEKSKNEILFFFLEGFPYLPLSNICAPSITHTCSSTPTNMQREDREAMSTKDSHKKRAHTRQFDT